MSNFGWGNVLGFLGLIGVLALIIIYILKPNYQQRSISSTHIWKLSLKYKRKRIPISKIRNILVIICQILIIAVSAFILAKPFIEASALEEKPEKIVIIDASASMRAGRDGITRFERAVSEIRLLGQNAIESGGRITLIVAGKEAYYMSVRTQSALELDNALNQLVRPDLPPQSRSRNLACTYGLADIDGAMILAETIIFSNPRAEILLYSASDYLGTVRDNNGVLRNSGVIIIDVSHPDEWNLAILDVRTTFEGVIVVDSEDPDIPPELIGENQYSFEVEVASFNKDFNNIELHFLAQNAEDFNGNIRPSVSATRKTSLFGNEPSMVYFTDLEIISFDSIRIWVEWDNTTPDSFEHDDEFFVFGGSKDKIRIQHISPAHSLFFNVALDILSSAYTNQWNIEITRTNLAAYEAGTSGSADFYIFEHEMPEMVPTDGAVLLVNPSVNSELSNLGLRFGDTIGKGSAPNVPDFVPEATNKDSHHRLLSGIDPSQITIFDYTQIIGYDSDYESIMQVGGHPVFLVKNSATEAKQKIAILPFNIHRSNLPGLLEFPMLLNNLFEFFMPPTLTKFVYDVDELVSVDTRGVSMTVYTPEGLLNPSPSSFPFGITASTIGEYVLLQELLSGETAYSGFFVKVPASESDFNHVRPTFKSPYASSPERNDWDLIIIFASTLVALWFLERMLHIKGEI